MESDGGNRSDRSAKSHFGGGKPNDGLQAIGGRRVHESRRRAGADSTSAARTSFPFPVALSLFEPSPETRRRLDRVPFLENPMSLWRRRESGRGLEGLIRKIERRTRTVCAFPAERNVEIPTAAISGAADPLFEFFTLTVDKARRFPLT
jgi:hypothetical protein